MTESITIEDVYQELTMEALRKSDLDIKEGRIKEVTSVEELLSEL